MSTIKINKLATSSVNLTDFIIKANSQGIATKATVQKVGDLLSVQTGLSFKGSLAIADTPNSDGWYFPSESGTYTNAGGLVVSLPNNLNIIIVSASVTSFQLITSPVSISVETVFDEDNDTDAFTGKAIAGYVDSKATIPTSSTVTITYNNLFDKNTMVVVDKTLNAVTGGEVSQTGAACSSFIPVESSTAYSFNTINVGSATLAVFFYDENKVFLSQKSNAFPEFKNHVTPANCKFIRYTLKSPTSSNDYNLTQYVQSVELTPYEPFGTETKIKEDVILKDNDYLADIYMIPSYGQSLSIGFAGGATTFTDIVPNSIDVTGAPSNVQDMNGGFVEMFNTLANQYKSIPEGFKIMSSVSGVGGASIETLSRGGSAYSSLLNTINEGRLYAEANNKTYNVPAICWTQGEAEMLTGGVPADYGNSDWNPFEYGAKLKKLRTDLNADIKGITGQKNDIKVIMYQVGSHNPYKRYPRIAIEQMKLCASDTNFVMAKTMYDIDYNNDEVHAPNKTYRNMGNHYGIALYRSLILKENFNPVFPISHHVVGNDVYIEFNTPTKPLAIDTTLVTALADGNYGFNLVTVSNETNGTSGTISAASQTITNVSLYNESTVKVTLSAPPPSGTRLTYGVNGTGWENISGTGGVNGTSGRVDGARGNLRDSQSYINPVDDYLNLHNWSAIFEIIL